MSTLDTPLKKIYQHQHQHRHQFQQPQHPQQQQQHQLLRNNYHNENYQQFQLENENENFHSQQQNNEKEKDEGEDITKPTIKSQKRYRFRRFSFMKRKNDNHINNNNINKRNTKNDKENLENLEQQSELLKDVHNSSATGKLNAGDDDEMIITGYRRSSSRTAFCWLCFILTFGLLRLIMHWWRHWLLLATHQQCSLEIAEKVLISEHYDGKHTVHYVKDVITLNSHTINQMQMTSNKKLNNLIPIDSTIMGDDEYIFQLAIHFSGGIFKSFESIRMFKCKQLRYVWDDNTNGFVKLKGLDTGVPSGLLHQTSGLTNDQQYARRLVYGFNQIAIPLRGIMTLLFLEVLNPYYVFQVFSVCLWFAYNYYYYAVVIVLMSAFGISMSIIQTRKNQLALYKTVMSTDYATVVNHNGKASIVETKYLVPGDILEIPSTGCTMQCDAVLLSGNCILDESMLTGESVPVTKTPLPCKRDLMFDVKEHGRHILFCGTKVIQTRYIGSEKVLAIVVNTGNITAKGGLIRSILYPPPVDYKFEQDSYKFIMLLAVVAGFGFIYTLVTKILRGVTAAKIAIESLDLITIAVPPALPAAMTVGRFYAQKRLERKNIYCISPRSINVSGSIDCVCFDKTGTLTEDGLDMWGVIPTSSINSFQIPLRQVERLPNDHFLFGMVTCHSITIMNNEMKGDPLDLKMFESTGWLLEEANVSDDTKYDLLFPTIVRPPKDTIITAISTTLTDNDLTNDNQIDTNNDIGIVREFSFTSSLQRMSVVTRKLMDSHFNVYCKGSPEMILSLCKPETIPEDFHEKLDIYAQQGYRIIAISYKSLDKKVSYPKVQRISREKIEIDLIFLGFVILENRLKDDTTEIIGNLMAANIRTIMVTGDNILTALSVAKDCNMITNQQNVIIVNVKQHNSNDQQYELVYQLSGGSVSTTPTTAAVAATTALSTQFEQNKKSLMSSSVSSVLSCIDKDNVVNVNNQHQQSTTNGCDYALMTNSNSISSFDTIDTCTQMTNITCSIPQHQEPLSLGNCDIECGKVQQQQQNACINNYRFAMIGKTWSIIRDKFPELLPKFVTRGTIFARMSPDQKQSLILELQAVGYYVAMCGDGANDCGALKAAHTGISLSEAESSVASPFTSKLATISCVPNIIKEGRAALVTSVGIFKYMAAYSLVQFMSVLILYSIDSNLTDIEFLYIDLFIISVFAFFFGKTESFDGPLVKQKPLMSLISIAPIISLLAHLFVAGSIQIIVWYHLHEQLWFKPFNYHRGLEFSHGCYENYAIFTISCYQYIILAIIFSKGKPYRKSIISNYGFLLTIIVNLIISCYITIIPDTNIQHFFELIMPPEYTFRIYICIYALINLLLSLLIEYYIIDQLILIKLKHYLHNINKTTRTYLLIENYLMNNTKWPPINQYSSSTINNNNCNKTNNDDDDNNVNQQIYVESSEIIDTQSGGIMFDKNNSVLNSFFDTDNNNCDHSQQLQQQQPKHTIFKSNQQSIDINDDDDDDDTSYSDSQYNEDNNDIIYDITSSITMTASESLECCCNNIDNNTIVVNPTTSASSSSSTSVKCQHHYQKNQLHMMPNTKLMNETNNSLISNGKDKDNEILIKYTNDTINYDDDNDDDDDDDDDKDADDAITADDYKLMKINKKEIIKPPTNMELAYISNSNS